METEKCKNTQFFCACNENTIVQKTDDYPWCISLGDAFCVFIKTVVWNLTNYTISHGLLERQQQIFWDCSSQHRLLVNTADTVMRHSPVSRDRSAGTRQWGQATQSLGFQPEQDKSKFTIYMPLIQNLLSVQAQSCPILCDRVDSSVQGILQARVLEWVTVLSPGALPDPGIKSGSLTCFYCCSVAESCLTLCDPMNCSTPGFPVLHYPSEFALTRVHWVRQILYRLSHQGSLGNSKLVLLSMGTHREAVGMSLWLLYKFLECRQFILLVKFRVLFLRFSETNIFRWAGK